MSDTINLKVLTPLGTVLETPATEVAVPGADGQFGILPMHTSYLAILTSGLLAYTSGGKREVLGLSGGLAEVNADHVVILTEEAFIPEQMDLGELEARERRYQEELQLAMSRGGETAGILRELAFFAELKALAAAR